MKFKIEDLEVVFPFESVYAEQLEMMLRVKQALDGKGHALIECPTGTGKTVALLSVITAYQQAHPTAGKLIYATRTVPEMTKCVEELRLVLKVREETLKLEGNKTLALCLSSRKNMCINEDAISCGDKEGGVDAACRRKTAPWVRKHYGRDTNKDGKDGKDKPTAVGVNAGQADEVDVQELWDREQESKRSRIAGSNGAMTKLETEQVATTTTTISNGNDPKVGTALCSFYEDFMENPSAVTFVPNGVYTLDDMRDLGIQRKWCPYFMARHLIEHANIVVYNFQYLLDPKVANLVSKELARESIVVFDESHNVDNVCIEALSVNFNRRSLDTALNRIGQLKTKVDQAKKTDRDRLTKEYEALVNGLKATGAVQESAGEESGGLLMGNPVLPDEILNEAIPGNIRKAESFIQMLAQIVVHLKKRMDEAKDKEVKTPTEVLYDFETQLSIEPKPLRFSHARLDSLMRTLQIVDLSEFDSVAQICDFLTLVSTYRDGFSVILEPFDPHMKEFHDGAPSDAAMAKFRDPVLELACLDASIAIKPVFSRFDSVIITSGTLSPIDLYPKLLNFTPKVSASLQMSITRPCIFPLIVTQGSDQSPISSEFELRNNPNTNRNFGTLLIDVSATVPDGIVGFFTAYDILEQTVAEWDANGTLAKVLEHKLIFIETKDVVETTLALDNFRRACDCGRGAVFLSVARGKVSEGIDFANHYGRAVILFGIPYQYTKSLVLQQRLLYLRRKFEIKDSDFLTFDAIRSASQCLGRVLRSKKDWGIMILADRRYNNKSKRSKLPPWIQEFLEEDNTNLSTDEAVAKIRGILRRIAQPVDDKKSVGKVLSEGDVERWGSERERIDKEKRSNEATASWE